MDGKENKLGGKREGETGTLKPHLVLRALKIWNKIRAEQSGGRERLVSHRISRKENWSFFLNVIEYNKFCSSAEENILGVLRWRVIAFVRCGVDNNNVKDNQS